MSEQEIDDYLRHLDEPKRSTLQRLRKTIQDIIPDAEQGISYGIPAFRLHGKVIAGFAAFKNHLTYVPHSGSVLPSLGEDLRSYTMTKSALHFAIDEALPARLVKKLIAVRLEEVRARQRGK